MAKSRGARRARKRAERQAAAPSPAEQASNQRAAEAATVGWMLAVLATLIAEVLAVVGAAIVAYAAPEDNKPGLIEMIPGSLGFTALVTGAAALVLTPIVRRVRVDRPPRLIEITALVAGGLPWFLLAISLVAKAVQ